MSEARIWAVVPAAGAGRRMGGEVPKQYLPLDGRPVIEHTLQRLLDYPGLAGVVVALSADDQRWRSCRWAGHPAVTLVAGGRERADSVCNALRALSTLAAPTDWVLVHDAARPCLRHADIDRLLVTLRNDPVGGLLAVPLHDTVKRADATGRVSETPPREQLWRAYTPQMFRLAPLLQALERALASGQPITDEASAMECAGLAPKLVEGHADNIKITRPADLELAAFYLAAQRARGD